MMENVGEEVDNKQAENELLVVNDKNPLFDDDEPSIYPKRARDGDIISKKNKSLREQRIERKNIKQKHRKPKTREIIEKKRRNKIAYNDNSMYPKRERIASSSNADIQQKPSKQSAISFSDSIKDRRIPFETPNEYNLMYGRYNLFLIIFMWSIFIVIQCFDGIDPDYCYNEYPISEYYYEEGRDACQADYLCGYAHNGTNHIRDGRKCAYDNDDIYQCCASSDKSTILNCFYVLLGMIIYLYPINKAILETNKQTKICEKNAML